MTYKTKITVLSGVIGALALAYILSLIFDPERVGSRSAAYSWLDAKQAEMIDRIIINNPDETITLVQRNGNWFITKDNMEYPARFHRVNDFIATLTKTTHYPVISSSASSHERLSLTPESGAIRVTLTGGVGLPLLDVFFGQWDSGRNVYMRLQGQNEVRSGENIFSFYINSSPVSWYNLRLFPETETGGVDISSVQSLTVYPPPPAAVETLDDESDVVEADPPAETGPLIFTRQNRAWTFNFELNDPDPGKVDSYIQDILNTSGNDFAGGISPSDPMFDYCRIMLQFGNGSIKAIRFSPENEENSQYFATVSGIDSIYSIPKWAFLRLFPDKSSFER